VEYEKKFNQKDGKMEAKTKNVKYLVKRICKLYGGYDCEFLIGASYFKVYGKPSINIYSDGSKSKSIEVSVYLISELEHLGYCIREVKNTEGVLEVFFYKKG